MDYQWHYNKLIETRKSRPLIKNEYYEIHHIIPISLGGSNKEENLIKLTAREHFIAHWLLYKICTNPVDKRKMSFAFFCFAFPKSIKLAEHRKLTSRQFEICRKTHSESMKGTIPWNKGKTGIYTQEQKDSMRKWQKGKKYEEIYSLEKSTSIKEKISKATVGENNPMFNKKGKDCPAWGRTGEKHPMFGKHHSDEVKKKISESIKGKKHTEETVNKMKTAAYNRPKGKCPHCGKEGVILRLKPYHFDNCKHKSE